MAYSTCNSAKGGGKLGKFKPGVMVLEFDDVVFGRVDNAAPKHPEGEVIGPVQTKFGYHLVRIDARNFEKDL